MFKCFLIYKSIKILEVSSVVSQRVKNYTRLSCIKAKTLN